MGGNDLSSKAKYSDRRNSGSAGSSRTRSRRPPTLRPHRPVTAGLLPTGGGRLHQRSPRSTISSAITSEKSAEDGGGALVDTWASPTIRWSAKQKARDSGSRSAPPHPRFLSRHKRKAAAAASEADGGDGTRSQLSDFASPVWDTFIDHVKGLSTAAADIDGGSKSSFRDRVSGTFAQALSRLQEMELRRLEKAAAATAAAEAEAAAAAVAKSAAEAGAAGHDETDLDEQLLEDAEAREALRQRALVHWSIVRRHVDERIRLRKENSTLSQSWNILRQQLRAMTRADKIRRDLYLRYGVVPADGQRYPRNSMMPSMSERAKEIILKFEAITLK